MSEAAPAATTVRCTVCGEDAPYAMTAECNWCDQRYHLNQRNDIEAQDCGQVWIDEQFLALQFACFNCLAKDSADPAAEPAAEPKPAAAPKSASGAVRQRRYKRRA